MRNYISLRDAAKLLPGPPSVCTLWRWCDRGFYFWAVDQVIRLEHVRIGRALYTTPEWLDEFFDRLSAANDAQREVRPGHRPSKSWQRRMAACEADIILRRAGI